MVKLGKDVRDVVKVAGQQGFSWDGKLTGSGHVKMIHENGGQMVIPATPGRYSWRRNALADIKRIAAGNMRQRRQ